MAFAVENLSPDRDRRRAANLRLRRDSASFAAATANGVLSALNHAALFLVDPLIEGKGVVKGELNCKILTCLSPYSSHFSFA